MLSTKKNALIAVLFLILVGVFYRLIDHPFNFSPLGSIAIFAGFFMRRKWSVLVPLAILLVSDIFLGFYTWQIMVAVYICLAVNVIMGMHIKDNKLIRNSLSVSIMGACIFFVVTNFAVWFFGNLYPHDFNGFVHCFYLALPFFRNSILGDMFYTSVILIAYKSVLFMIGHGFFMEKRKIITAN